MTEDKARADQLLLVLVMTDRKVEKIQAAYAAKLAALQSEYGTFFQEVQKAKAETEKELLAIMKKGKGAIFDGRERIALTHGILLHGREDRVTIPRNALALAEQQGLDDAIKIAKSIDRDTVEKWPDERLTLIGAQRKRKDSYTYELK